MVSGRVPTSVSGQSPKSADVKFGRETGYTIRIPYVRFPRPSGTKNENISNYVRSHRTVEVNYLDSQIDEETRRDALIRMLGCGKSQTSGWTRFHSTSAECCRRRQKCQSSPLNSVQNCRFRTFYFLFLVKPDTENLSQPKPASILRG